MNKFFQLLLAFLIGILFSFGLFYNDIWPFENCCNDKIDPGVIDTFSILPNEIGDGVSITPNEAILAIANYEYAFLRDSTQRKTHGALGGRISVDVLNNLIQNCRANNASFVNFRYGYKNTSVVDEKRIYLILSGGQIFNPLNNMLMFRNSGSSYCPTQCNY